METMLDIEIAEDEARKHEVIFSTDPTSRRFAWHELREAAPGSRLVVWLASDVGRAVLTVDWDTLVERFRAQPPIFCRHIFPVQQHVSVHQDEEIDLNQLSEVASHIHPPKDPNQAFSVQTRLLGKGWPYGPYDVNTRLADLLLDAGGELNVRRPVWVLSVVLTPEAGFLGFSRAENNLSDWAGGARRFKREKGQISRAEFKFLEALEVFDLTLPEGGTALDLGAAPGGWTRLLLRQGLRVVAVDPAELAPSLQRAPKVQHVRMLAQDYLPGVTAAFDVILNDMRMDARESARLMHLASDALKPDGWMLMTLKLPKHNLIEAMTGALDILRERYVVAGVRQLFHNRSEVTVALRRRG